jgi:hypothetical protein
LSDTGSLKVNSWSSFKATAVSLASGLFTVLNISKIASSLTVCPEVLDTIQRNLFSLSSFFAFL